MSTAALSVVAAAALALALLGAVLVVRGRARAHALAVRRAAAIERLADSIDWVAEELDRRPPTAAPHPSPPETARRTPRTDPTTGLPARAALVDELVHGVETARREGSRLGLALVAVEASGIGLEPAMADVAKAARLAAPGAATFRAGEHALALVLPAAGRADAIAAVARLEASLAGTPPLTSSVVELEPGEDAATLLTRAASAP